VEGEAGEDEKEVARKTWEDRGERIIGMRRELHFPSSVGN
jgi:hypothetical protein